MLDLAVQKDDWNERYLTKFSPTFKSSTNNISYENKRAKDPNNDRLQETQEMENLKNNISHELVDNVGGVLSCACAVHCVAMPLLVTVLPLLGLGFLASESAESIIIGAVALAMGSVVWGVRHHRHWRAFLIIVVAIAFIAIGHVATEGIFEVVFHTTAGILLATAHLVNRHLCRICPACGDESQGESRSLRL